MGEESPDYNFRDHLIAPDYEAGPNNDISEAPGNLQDESTDHKTIANSTPIDSGEAAPRPTLPAEQSREAWTNELSMLLTEARARGDTRPKIQIVNEWLRFRKSFEAPEDKSL